MQDMGLSASSRHYNIDQLVTADPELVKRIYTKIKGNIQENSTKEDTMPNHITESSTSPEVQKLAKQLYSGAISLDEFQASIAEMGAEYKDET